MGTETSSIKKKLTEFILVTFGVLLVTFGVYFFKFPNNFCIGGVTGLSILVNRLTDGAVSTATVVTIANMSLLVIGFLIFGRSFGVKTAYGTVLMSGVIILLERFVPITAPLTDEPILELFFAVAVPAIGAAILFNIGGSTGGTDVIAMILKKYTSIDIGKSLLCVDLLLTIAVFPVFGLKTGMLSLTGLVIKTTVIDSVIESLNLCKYFTVICDDPHPICEYIIHTMKRSATICDARGAFSEHQKKVILTVMNRSQAVHLRQFIRDTEPSAFILITNTSEIIGRGFRS